MLVGLKRLAHVRLMSGYIGGANLPPIDLVWRAPFSVNPHFQGLHFILSIEVYIIVEIVYFLDCSGAYAAKCTQMLAGSED